MNITTRDRFLVEAFDPVTANEDDFRARWEAGNEIWTAISPEVPITPFDKHRHEMVNHPSHSRPQWWTVWDGERRSVVALGELELEYLDTNRHLAWFEVGVREAYRRQAIGSVVVRHIADAALADGRTLIGGGVVDGPEGEGFCAAVGLEKKATDRKSRLVTAGVDRAKLEGWIERAAERAAEYELIAYDDQTPDELLDAFVDLKFVTNTAPKDDLELDDRRDTPEMVREQEALMAARGDGFWRIVARHRPSGQLAAFTEFWFDAATPSIAWQGWTATRPEHRNRGLGRWIKAANCVRLLDEHPEVEAIDTWNAFSNGPMLGINIEMGFEMLRGYSQWQAPTDRIVEAISARS